MAKDESVHGHNDLPVDFVPVQGASQAQPQTVNIIVGSLGGQYTQPKDGDKVSKQEGWVPPSNRDGDTFKEDPWLGKHKVAVLNALDSQGDLSEFPRVLDPRDNDKADDTWEGNPGTDDKQRQAQITKSEKLSESQA